jgi:HD-GYP domain-containing protein (c-di-GMP phosphodiesterase class II)
MVADVYDALTDDRVYRPAWPPGQAFELLDSYAGNALDRACVDALHDVLSRASTPGMRRAEPRGAPAHPPRRPRRGPSEQPG